MNLWIYDQSGNPALTTLPYSKLDIVSPAHLLDQTGNSQNVDPTTGMPIYPAGQNQISTPVAPGRVITRYFIGLIDNQSGADTTANKQTGMPVNSSGAYNGYNNALAIPNGADNRTTLYKAVFTSSIPGGSGGFIPNLDLFHTVNAAGVVTDTEQGSMVLNDPNFFYDDSLAGPSNDSSHKQGDPFWGLPGWQRVAQKYGMPTTTVYRWENWAAISSSLMETSKADAVAANRNDDGTLQYCSVTNIYGVTDTAVPTIHPLVSFNPHAVVDEAAQPNATSASGDEVASVAPALFTTKYAAWAQNYSVEVFRANTQNGGANDALANPGGYYQYYNDPAGASHIVLQNPTAPVVPSTLPDVGPDMAANGLFSIAQLPKVQMAFTPDPSTGQVNFAFPQWATLGEVGVRQMYVPSAVNTNLTGSIGTRYILLNQLPQTSYSVGPFTPGGSQTPETLNNYPGVSPLALPSASVSIVPGSERVYGPDQVAGGHYGHLTLYTRVPSLTGSIGPNEYRINYSNLPGFNPANPDPRLEAGYVEFDSQNDTPDLQNLNASPTNPLYAANSLPTWKFDSGSGTYMFADPVEISYQFQTNLQTDAVQVSYATQNRMTVSMDARIYDPTSTLPEQSNLVQSVALTNMQR